MRPRSGSASASASRRSDWAWARAAEAAVNAEPLAVRRRRCRRDGGRRRGPRRRRPRRRCTDRPRRRCRGRGPWPPPARAGGRTPGGSTDAPAGAAEAVTVDGHDDGVGVLGGHRGGGVEVVDAGGPGQQPVEEHPDRRPVGGDVRSGQRWPAGRRRAPRGREAEREHGPRGVGPVEGVERQARRVPGSSMTTADRPPSVASTAACQP